MIGNGFNLLNVNPIYQQIVEGGIIVVAVAVDTLGPSHVERNVDSFRRKTPRTSAAVGVDHVRLRCDVRVDRQPQLEQPGDDLEGEFGAVAVPRILSLHQRHHVTTTFFVPGGNTALATRT